jgi:ketosteroid isomerase-like protein
MDKAFAEHFAADWIGSWNAHDLRRVLSHYADDFEMSSPVIIQVAAEPSGTLRGKAAVGAYWAKALELTPNVIELKGSPKAKRALSETNETELADD